MTPEAVRGTCLITVTVWQRVPDRRTSYI